MGKNLYWFEMTRALWRDGASMRGYAQFAANLFCEMSHRNSSSRCGNSGNCKEPWPVLVLAPVILVLMTLHLAAVPFAVVVDPVLTLASIPFAWRIKADE